MTINQRLKTTAKARIKLYKDKIELLSPAKTKHRALMLKIYQGLLAAAKEDVQGNGE